MRGLVDGSRRRHIPRKLRNELELYRIKHFTRRRLPSPEISLPLPRRRFRRGRRDEARQMHGIQAGSGSRPPVGIDRQVGENRGRRSPRSIIMTAMLSRRNFASRSTCAELTNSGRLAIA